MRLLDLFCGEGLAAWGYWQSGRFSEIVGVDNDSSKAGHYAFDFIAGDALALDYEFLMSFDFIHASPPCQAYSRQTPDPASHPRLIIATHRMLTAAGVPYVIENVEGSGKELRPNLTLTGRDVGLPMRRIRYFHVSAWPGAKKHEALRTGSSQIIDDCRINLTDVANVSVHARDKRASRSTLIQAFGLSVIPEKRLRSLTCDGIEQGIPPAFTRRIAESVISRKFSIG